MILRFCPFRWTAQSRFCGRICSSVCRRSTNWPKQKQLTFADINGFNFLLRSELGFWDALCREKMPSSKFLVQTDDAVFDELVKASSLPCFTTDYGQLQGGYPDRVNIPLTDDAAHITFYLLRR